jgi:multiple sugar transport system permease protein
LLVTVGTIFISSLSGYAFARLRFGGRSFLFLLLLNSIMLPLEVTIIPNFHLMTSLNLINTHVPLIIMPILGANGVIATFIMRQYFLTLPPEIEDAAMPNGLNRAGIYWHIALPLAQPAIGAVAILTFLHSWNSFLEPLIYVNDLALFTLPLSLHNFTDAYGLPLWHLQLAATTLLIIPILIIYIQAQRRVMNSFVLSGIKG